MLETKGKEVTHFVINYRARFKELGDQWFEVYRVDTCHGYLHEQRFWISHKPIPMELRNGQTLKDMFLKTISLLKTDFHRFRGLYVQSMTEKKAKAPLDKYTINRSFCKKKPKDGDS